MRYDAIVIGGSFAGLSAAIYVARARRSVCVVDAGLPRNRFAAASHGFFGQDGSKPSAMIAQACEQLRAYPTVSVVEDTAAAAAAEDGGFLVTLASGGRLRASKLVLAFGVSDMLPDIPGLSGRWGHSVLHCPYCHGYEFSGRCLGVLNAASFSSHQAMLIAEWGPTTFFLNGRDDLGEATRKELARRGVAIEPAAVVALDGEGQDLSGVRLADGRTVELAALFLASRTRLNSPIAAQLGCAIDEGPFGPIIRTDEGRLTSVPGVYAAGDAARVPHSATWAAADGVTAGTSLHRALVFEPLAA